MRLFCLCVPAYRTLSELYRLLRSPSSWFECFKLKTSTLADPLKISTLATKVPPPAQYLQFSTELPAPRLLDIVRSSHNVIQTSNSCGFISSMSYGRTFRRFYILNALNYPKVYLEWSICYSHLVSSEIRRRPHRNALSLRVKELCK